MNKFGHGSRKYASGTTLWHQLKRTALSYTESFSENEGNSAKEQWSMLEFGPFGLWPMAHLQILKLTWPIHKFSGSTSGGLKFSPTLLVGRELEWFIRGAVLALVCE